MLREPSQKYFAQFLTKKLAGIVESTTYMHVHYQQQEHLFNMLNIFKVTPCSPQVPFLYHFRVFLTFLGGIEMEHWV